MDNNIMKPKYKRLLLDVQEKFHNNIKSRSAKQGLNIKQYIIQAIFERIEKENNEEELSKL